MTECPYIFEDCKRKSTQCFTNYQSCPEWHKRYLKELRNEEPELGIGAVVDFVHIVNGRFQR